VSYVTWHRQSERPLFWTRLDDIRRRVYNVDMLTSSQWLLTFLTIFPQRMKIVRPSVRQLGLFPCLLDWHETYIVDTSLDTTVMVHFMSELYEAWPWNSTASASYAYYLESVNQYKLSCKTFHSWVTNYSNTMEQGRIIIDPRNFDPWPLTVLLLSACVTSWKQHNDQVRRGYRSISCLNIVKHGASKWHW